MATKFHIDKSITWWVRSPPQRKKSTNSTFNKDVVDFVGHTSLHSYSRMVDPTFGFWEKVLWFCIHVLAGSVLIVFLSDAWVEFVQQYFATTLYDPLYPIEWVPFPAVSICSNNRISLRAAEKYAAELSKVDPDKGNTSVFLERIKLLGWLYNRESFVDTPDSYVFQQFLDLYGTGENESYYNTLNVMARLTPPCEQLLIKCSVAGKDVNCLSNDTFRKTLTSYGFCCTFNSNDMYSSRKASHRFAEPNLGLTVVLNTSSADMHFPILRTDGTVVLIHSATKFPDISSGGSSETLIINGDENYLSILPYVVDSVESIRQFSPKTNESPNVYKLGGLKYSFNNCVTRCRIRSIIVLCRCLPFNYPYALTPNETNTVYCTLRHLACLQRYRFKWKSVLSHRIVAPGLETEIEDALYCPHCLPSCDDITYEVYLNTLPLKDDLPFYDQNDVTVLRVYFAESYIKYYRQIVRNSWFEAFSTVGNYCGIVLGFSMIIIFEVVYFIGGQITSVLWQGMRNGHQALTIYP